MTVAGSTGCEDKAEDKHHLAEQAGSRARAVGAEGPACTQAPAPSQERCAPLIPGDLSNAVNCLSMSLCVCRTLCLPLLMCYVLKNPASVNLLSCEAVRFILRWPEEI